MIECQINGAIGLYSVVCMCGSTGLYLSWNTWSHLFSISSFLFFLSLTHLEFFFPFNFIIRRILLIDQLGKKVENSPLKFLKLEFNSKLSFKNLSSRVLTQLTWIKIPWGEKQTFTLRCQLEFHFYPLTILVSKYPPWFWNAKLSTLNSISISCRS